jgi:S-adenosylmethionine:tRNA ribosyltransferase-isomerase
VSAVTTFTLPPANEATSPPERRGLKRDGVRLLVSDRAARTHRDATFRDLASFLRPGDLLVANDSATMPAALSARRADGETFALHLSTRIADDLWIAEPRAPAAAGERVALAGGDATFLAPIRYRYVTEAFPLEDYRTVFARVRHAELVEASAEMPSAGRPFTRRVLDDLDGAGVALATVTLHTGVSSPERGERPYREWYEVSPQTAAAVNATLLRGGRVIAIGTTVVRALESAVADGEAIPSSGWTSLIVTPERGVALVDGLLTGFHEPQASHLDLLRAFADQPFLASAYDHAIERGYLWHEFGDVHLVL